MAPYALALTLIAIPVALIMVARLGTTYNLIVSFGVIVLILVAIIVSYEKTLPTPQEMMPVVVFSALAIAGRLVFALTPGFKPVTAIVIIEGMVFGRRSGLMTGMLAALGSNIFFGQGPWTPWQMYAWGLVGYLAGLFFKRGVPPQRQLWVVLIFGFLVSLLYGFIVDTHVVVGYVRPLTAASALTVYVAGLPWNIVHGVATVFFLALTTVAWGRRLERVREKFGFTKTRATITTDNS